MNKKILGIVIGAIVLTLGIVIAINYNDMSKNQASKDQAINQSKTENVANDKKSEKPKEEPGEISIGKPAPDFTLKNLKGEEVSLSDYKGKIVLINFWATWCKFCDVEMPDLNAIDKNNDDVVVLAVNVMEEESKVSEYIKKNGYDFEVALDTTGDIAKNYLVSAFPTTYAVDKDGVLISGVPGMLTKVQMEQIIEKARAGK